jgi:predicted amidohydrolase YtcJ
MRTARKISSRHSSGLRRHSPGRNLIVFFAIAALSTVCREKASPVRADLILKNAAVYTLDAMRPWAEAVAVAGEKIIYVGENGAAAKFSGEKTRVLDLRGRMILPGFHDSHIHLVSGGLGLAQCDLNGLRTKEEILAKIRRYAEEHPEKDWIAGGGWDLPIFPEANPAKEELDSVVSDRPACLSAADGHSSWVNSRALELAGVTAKTPDPQNGRIERKPGTLEPSGTLREAAAGLVSRLIPEPTAGEYLEGLRAGLSLANASGITSVIEASADEKILEAYAELDRRGELTVRVLASLRVNRSRGTEQVEDLVRLRDRYKSPRLKAAAAKIFIDGVIESHTAALLEPYIDRPQERGTPILGQEDFNRLAVALDGAGFQIHVHAIGDRGVRMALDAVEAARKANGARDSRHHFAHLELIDPADIPRFKALGVAANFQPLWAYADAYITKLTEPILGPERSRRLYQIGSLVRSGALVAAGSDWDVSSFDPLAAIQVAVTRRGLEDAAGTAWLPEETIDLPTAIAAYTISGAYLSFDQDLNGSIEMGKAADIVILDRNIFKIPPSEIHKARVLLTLLDGKIVYSSQN